MGKRVGSSTCSLSSPLKKPKKKTAETPCLPEDIIHCKILPRVPLKSLFRFKSVSKTWNRTISDDPLFALRQSLHSKFSCASTISVNRKKGGRLVVLSTFEESPVGIPDPFLRFIGDNVSPLAILSSTNGLLCIRCHDSSRQQEFLYVCNPATMKGTCVPAPEGMRSFVAVSVGLAFDPSVSLDRYELVHPIRSNGVNQTVEYRFKVLSSRRREWIKSDQVVVLGEGYPWKESKPVFTKGVLYWYCDDYLLWFDCNNEISGYTLMPGELLSFTQQDIGVCRDRVSLTRLSDKGLEVWTMTDRHGWEKMYETRLETMVEGNIDLFGSFWTTMTLRSRDKVSKGLVKRYRMQPLPFEGGGRVLLRVRVRNSRYNGDGEKEKVLSYDVKTGKMGMVLYEGGLFQEWQQVFGYNNSMVPFQVMR
ncbi:F-box protein At5g49610-like isoform X2 [Asparagus officinalis]|uniref:F-box protein At5g49610-like isoform X1 n=1 Tax=Asparagus officinalis TaxID=4686 RepID=UPI00098E3C3C|nr:F-box protein At5g49610-like isoform X1 [Asparagus officinalis]XP_020273528.1 F-box protein At5g49610-like isoform X2 [Asparagus officinalis]